METEQIENDLVAAKNRTLEVKNRISKSREVFYSRDDLNKHLGQKFHRLVLIYAI